MAQVADAQGVGRHVITKAGKGTTIDWTRGLIIARGAAAGDLRAPGPQVARLAAERKARAAARQKLALAAAQIPAGPDKQVTEELLSSLEKRTIDLSIDHGSDGSVVAEVGLPLEAVRSELHGALAMPEAEGDGPTALVIDARKVVRKPLVGLTVISGAESYQGPTIFVTDSKSASADPRLGDRPEAMTGRSYDGGKLTIDERAADRLAAARRGGAVVVVILGKGK